MEIKHEIVRQLHNETGDGMIICKQALQHFDGDYARAKRSLEKHQWHAPLCGVVCVGEPKYEYTGKDDWEEFDYNFWHNRIVSHRQEVYLTKDGKIDYKRSGWPERISEIREREERDKIHAANVAKEIAEFKIPTVADIIMSSVNQFLAGVKFRDQYFTYKFPQEYVLNSGMAYRSYIHKEDKDFVWLKFPMKEYMEWNKIGFDDSYYTFNGKSVLLKDLMKKV